MSRRKAPSFLDLFREMNREFEHEAEEFFRQIKEAEILSGCMIPLYTVNETATEVIVTIDTPGAEKENIHINLTEELLELDAACSRPPPATRGIQPRYRLTIELPAKVDPDSASAKYREGVLEVRAPKVTSVGKRITVQ